jgi:YidC/Oxa1 family membrane protein insertase
MWLDLIHAVLSVLASDVGLGLGFAIALGTVLLRSVLLPLSWPIAYRGYIRRKKMIQIQPTLQRLKKLFRDKPDVYLQKMSELYRKHDLTLVDHKSLLATAVQMPLLIGMYQVLRELGRCVKFLWVSNLLKPDTWLAILVGLTAAVMMAVTPDMSEHMRLFMILVPGIIAFFYGTQILLCPGDLLGHIKHILSGPDVSDAICRAPQVPVRRN